MLTRGSYFLLFSLAILLSSFAMAQSDEVVAEFGGHKITLKEFEDAYAKSAGGYEEAKKDSMSKLKNFLDLYVNFKMKLRNAWVRGYDEDSALVAELQDYKQKVGTKKYFGQRK